MSAVEQRDLGETITSFPKSSDIGRQRDEKGTCFRWTEHDQGHSSTSRMLTGHTTFFFVNGVKI